MADYATVKLKLRAVIGEHEFTDVVQFTSAIAANTIPVASLLVAVGADVRNIKKLATIHAAISDIKLQRVAEVFLRTEITSVSNVGVVGVPHDAEIKVFRGKVVGTGWRRTATGAHFTIHLLHWLGELNNASSGSASLHPGGAAALAAPAVFPAAGRNASSGAAGTGSAGNPAWVPTFNKTYVGEDGLADIWGNVLHKWMTEMASDDPFEKSLPGGQPGSGNANTLDALSRMQVNPDGMPLELSLKEADAFTISNGISAALMRETGGNWINTTLWGKLIGEWAPAYLFSVIPRIDDALIVPFTGGLQGEAWAVIGDEDYVQADLNAQMHQVLRAVWIAYPASWYSGADVNRARWGIDQTGAAGVYSPPDLTQGVVMIKGAPKWLSDPLHVHTQGALAEGMTPEGDKPIGNALDPKVPNPAVPVRDVPEVMRQTRGLMDSYAHQLYALEALKGRIGEVAGKLRFDIAPGSNVLVRAGGAKNVPAATDIQEDMYATVLQVACVINAESQKAGTAFTLTHIRTEEENKHEATSVVKPPLYTTAWRGAALVKAEGINPEG